MNLYSHFIIFEVLIGIGYGFYVPGIAPREFAVGDLIGKDF
jgi:hypothetical protein